MKTLFEPGYTVLLVPDEEGKPYISKQPYSRKEKTSINSNKKKESI